MPIMRASAWWPGSRRTIAWYWSNERPRPVHPPGTPRRDRALSLDGAVLPGALWFRAEDSLVANGHRAAALCSRVRSRAGVSHIEGAAELSLDNFRLLLSDN